MRHPSEGVLRRLVDDPAGVADADRRHVAGCEGCRDRLAAVRRDADLVQAALAVDGADAVTAVDLAHARRRLVGATSVPARPRPVAPRRPGRVRQALRRPVVVGVAVVAVLAGAGTAAANDWFQIFQAERVAPVSVSAADLVALPDLEAYGEVVATGQPGLHPVPDAATAAAETGLDVPQVATLPAGVTGEPSTQVGGEVSVTFTYSAARAAQAAAEAGEEPPAPPPGLDGSQVRLVAGPGVAAVWSGPGGVPNLVVGRAVAPRAFSSSGVPFDVVRDHLLALPGLPEDVAAQLRALGSDGSTVPLPVPAERVTTATAQVHGAEATVVTTDDGSLAAVAWVEDGLVTVVAGPLSADEVLSVAQGLR